LDLHPIEIDLEWVQETRDHFRIKLEDVKQFVKNCTRLPINAFPEDLFTEDERRSGWIMIHIFLVLYVFLGFAIVCGDYFVPAVELMSAELHLERDIAGATLMGIATSSPELFTNVIGVFVMRGDIGVGTIVGSAVFNHLAICSCIGLGTRHVVNLDWWPISRDVIFYSVSVLALLLVLWDERIYWYEATSLLFIYAVYIYGMLNDEKLQISLENIPWIHAFSRRNRRHRQYSVGGNEVAKEEDAQSNGNLSSSRTAIFMIPHCMTGPRNMENGTSGNLAGTELIQCIRHSLALFTRKLNIHMQTREQGHLHSPFNPMPSRESGSWNMVKWGLSWPIRFLLSLTIPDCRSPKLSHLYPVTFVSSTLWIAALSYVASWMMTVVGHTLMIPDTVFGVSGRRSFFYSALMNYLNLNLIESNKPVIAAGTSVPEAVSSVFVARRGFGTMAVSNAVGSNTFNILVCLGLPWLIRCIVNANSENNYAEIGSRALQYSTMMLILSIALMHGIILWNGFCINKRIAASALGLYIAFLTFDSLIELNMFFNINLPLCN
ncbi:Sodium/potassium/calcium exchanger 5, partial [Folsomia candida]